MSYMSYIVLLNVLQLSKIFPEGRKTMADKTMLNFRCPAELLDTIDTLGQELHPSNSAHGCDRTKTLLDIVRAGIEALSNGTVVLQTSDADDKNVRQRKTEDVIDIEARFAAIEERLGKLRA
jgi:hypothetical protein